MCRHCLLFFVCFFINGTAICYQGIFLLKMPSNPKLKSVLCVTVCRLHGHCKCNQLPTRIGMRRWIVLHPLQPMPCNAQNQTWQRNAVVTQVLNQQRSSGRGSHRMQMQERHLALTTCRIPLKVWRSTARRRTKSHTGATRARQHFGSPGS